MYLSAILSLCKLRAQSQWHIHAKNNNKGVKAISIICEQQEAHNIRRF